MYAAKPVLLPLHTIQILSMCWQHIMIVGVYLLLHVVLMWTVSLLSELFLNCDTCQGHTVPEFLVSETKKKVYRLGLSIHWSTEDIQYWGYQNIASRTTWFYQDLTVNMKQCFQLLRLQRQFWWRIKYN